MKRRLSFRSILLIVIVFAVTIFYQLPYYVTKPGMAQELGEVVRVDDGYEQSGSFMLTTVRMGRANIYSYGLGVLGKYHTILPLEAVQSKEESDEEYMIRQLYYMDTSKQAAIAVAYEAAGLEVSYDRAGVYVLSLMDGMPAKKQLQLGDRIVQIDNKTFESQEEFVTYVGSKDAGDEVVLTIEREDKTRTETITLARYKDMPDKVGIGIGLIEDREIITDPKVSIETKDIGGPSAGLMFSLAVYNQLVAEDYTRGHKIAGTGTVNLDGTVGPIGGIDQKVVAADKSGASVFFAPFEQGKANSNFDVAVKAAKDIKTEMVIVPVDTFDDALRYLQYLK